MCPVWVIAVVIATVMAAAPTPDRQAFGVGLLYGVPIGVFLAVALCLGMLPASFLQFFAARNVGSDGRNDPAHTILRYGVNSLFVLGPVLWFAYQLWMAWEELGLDLAMGPDSYPGPELDFDSALLMFQVVKLAELALPPLLAGVMLELAAASPRKPAITES